MVKMKQLKLMVVILFCMLLLCQETMINPVFCFKADGTTDLEIAVAGFTCPCPHNHYNQGLAEKNHGHATINTLPLCCFDLPLGDIIHSKNTPNETCNISLVQIQMYNINTFNSPLLSDIWGRSFFRQLPLTKFLVQPALPDTSPVLLCWSLSNLYLFFSKNKLLSHPKRRIKPWNT